MGVIKVKSDQNIIDNINELVTPLKVREVNDVIDAQVEAVKTSIITLEESVTTLTSNTVPSGGISGQILAKNSDTDNDVHWIDAAISGSNVPSGGTTGQVLAKNSDNDGETQWIDVPNGSGDYLPLAGGTMTGSVDFPIRKGLNFIAERSDSQGGNYGTWISGNTLGNFRYIAPIDDFDVHFDFLEGIYHHYQNKALSYSSDYSANYTARSLVDKAYVDSKALPSGGLNGQVLTKTAIGQEWQTAQTDISGLLPLAGGAMVGDIIMQERWLRNIGGLTYYNSYFSLEEALFDLQGGIMSYAQTPTPNAPNNLIHKGYVDAKATREYVHTQFVTGADPQIVNIPHGLNTKKIMVIIKYGSDIIAYPNRLINATDMAFDYAFDADEQVNVTVIAFP